MATPTRTRGWGDAKRIVLVGPDCSGKSSLAERLSAHYGIPIVGNRRINEPLEAANEVINFTRKFIHQLNTSFILDQWQYPVDIIYGEILRGEKSVMRHVEKIIAPYLDKVLFIHVDARDEVLRQRFEKRGDELWNIDQILKVAHAYRATMNELPINHYYLDTSDVSMQEAYLGAQMMIDVFFKEE